MAVLLANADANFPFVDCVRRHAADLFPTPGVEKTRVIDFAHPRSNRDSRQLDLSEVDRQIWGYWPTERIGDPVLIRDDLAEFANAAMPKGDEAPDRSVLIILIDRDLLGGLANDRPVADDKGLSRRHLEELKSIIAGGPIGETTRKSAAITENLFLRRVLAVQSFLAETPEVIALADTLVRDDLIDTVVFLAARDPNHQRAKEAYFVALRLLEVAAGVPDIEPWFDTRLIGEKQAPNSVCRIEIDLSILGLRTASHRRLAMLRDSLDNLKRVTVERQRAGIETNPDEVKMTDAKIKAILKDIRKDDGDLRKALRLPSYVRASADDGSIQPTSTVELDPFAGWIFGASRLQLIAERAETDVNRLSNRLRADIAFVSPESIRLDSRPARRGEPIADLELVEAEAENVEERLHACFDFDASLGRRIGKLETGGFRDGQGGKVDLQRLRGDLGAEIEAAIEAQGKIRDEIDSALHGNHRRDIAEHTAEERLAKLVAGIATAVREKTRVSPSISAEAGAVHALEPPAPAIAPSDNGQTALALDGPRRGRVYSPSIAADRALHAHATRMALESARGLFRPAALLVFLIPVLAIGVPLLAAGVLTRDTFVAAITLSSSEVTFVALLTIVILFTGGLLGAIGAKKELSRSGTRLEERWFAVVDAAREPLGRALHYRGNRITGGRLLLLRRRLAELDRELTRLNAIKDALARIAPPPMEEAHGPRNPREPEDYSAFRADIESRLADTPRERWAIEILRHPDPGETPVAIGYRNAGATRTVVQRVFTVAPSEVEFEQLAIPSAVARRSVP